ncbi:MAG: 30S ribosomal protein S1 [Candidatus Latescibacteria bacterium]|nr:30S ribosomal protein S1 [Candidatus Latescibacterota bacterium]
MSEEKISEASQEEQIPEDAETHPKGGDAVAETTPVEEYGKAIETSRNEDPFAAWASYEEKEYSDEEFSEMQQLYDETMQSVVEGEIVSGTILRITGNDVVVDIGFKSEGTIPIEEFGSPEEVQVGDEVHVYLEHVEDQEGQVVLSKQKADFMRVWDRIREAHENGEVVEGRLTRRIKGGIVVDLMGVEAFLPGSQIDVRQVKNFDQFIGEVFPLKIIKLNKSRRNIVVSRRVVLEEERNRLREEVLAELEVGQVRKGVVKNITDFGAFIDLGGVDGLLHITDMSWGRVSHPSELVAIGDELEVKILNYEAERDRISLGLKQLTAYPWEHVEEKYPVGEKVRGKIVSITDYGAFVELEEGIEGLVHISEMSWTQHIRHPSKVVAIGDVVEAVILKINKAEEKISLGLKQVEPDPWETLDERYPVGSRVMGKVRNLTNFGAFVEVEEGIDGLVHISDMSWTRRIHHPSEVMKKGEMAEVVVLNIDRKKRRISLGYKQTIENPWETLAARYAEGTETIGRVVRLLDRGAIVELDGDVEGFVPTSQLAQPGIRKPEEVLSVGDELPLKVIEFDGQQRRIVLSVREYFRGKEREELEAYRAKYAPKPTTVGEVAETLEPALSEEAGETAEPSTPEETSKPSEGSEKVAESETAPGKEASKPSEAAGEIPAPSDTALKEEVAEETPTASEATEEKSEASKTALKEEVAEEAEAPEVPDTASVEEEKTEDSSETESETAPEAEAGTEELPTKETPEKPESGTKE